MKGKVLCALALAAALLCAPAAAYEYAGNGALRTDADTLLQDLNTVLSGAEETSLPTLSRADGAVFTASYGVSTLQIAGTQVYGVSVFFPLSGATDTRAREFGALCGAVLRVMAPTRTLSEVNAALQLDDTATQKIRTCFAKPVLLTYDVSGTGIRMSAVVLHTENDAIQIVVNDRCLSLDAAPVLDQGRTYVPVRGIFEELGAQVTWDQGTQTATLQQAEQTVRVTVGSTQASVNGQPVTLDAPARLVGGHTLVPVRFLAEQLGARVGWDQDAQVVVIATR